MPDTMIVTHLEMAVVEIWLALLLWDSSESWTARVGAIAFGVNVVIHVVKWWGGA